jgi:hypothetical protein
MLKNTIVSQVSIECETWTVTLSEELEEDGPLIRGPRLSAVKPHFMHQ